MLDHFFKHPATAFLFILLVVYLGLIYLLNRERSKVARMRGPRRFQPDWSRSLAGAPKRRRRRGGDFKPEWNPHTPSRTPGARKSESGTSAGESGRVDAGTKAPPPEPR